MVNKRGVPIGPTWLTRTLGQNGVTGKRYFKQDRQEGYKSIKGCIELIIRDVGQLE